MSVLSENQQPVEPRRNRPVLVAERVRQRHEPDHRIAREVRAAQRDLRHRKEDDRRDQTLGDGCEKPLHVGPASYPQTRDGLRWL